MYLQYTLIVLTIIVVYKISIDSYKSNNKYYNSNKNDEKLYIDDENKKYDKMLNDVQNETIKKINAVSEQSYVEGFSSMNNNNNNRSKSSESSESNSSSKINSINDTKIKLMLFYKTSCGYCKKFLPTWYKIINNMPNNVMYEEINCDDSKNNKKVNENKITGVPTLILVVNDEKTVYSGDRSYDSVLRFLKNNGVNLVERTFEKFDETGYSATDINSSNDPSLLEKKSKVCPSVTFDKQLDVAEDNYMFQIFDDKGQFGYQTGGNKDNKLFTPFTAAYSVVDSYLSSLPNPANINECATLYSNQIRSFGLCDTDELNKILSYQDKVKNGSAKTRVNNTDYSSNSKIVRAIKASCQM